VKRQVIDTKAGKQFFNSAAFIGIVVAGGIFFLVVGLVTLYFYLQRKKELASTSSSSAASSATPSSGTALDDMKSAVYDPHASSAAAAPHSDLFNPLPLEPSGIYDAVDTSSAGTAGSNQYAKLPVTKEQLRASDIHAAAAAAADVNDEEYGQLELFKAAEGAAGADVNREGYGIISQSLIKQPSEKKMKTKKSKSKVALDPAAVTTARAADDLMKSARHEYGSPNLPVVGQYSNTPEAPPADHPAAPKGRKVAFQTVAFGKNSDAAAAAAAAEDADDAKPAAAPFKTVAFGGTAKPLPAKPAPAKPAAAVAADDDVPAVTSKTVAFGKMPPKPTGGGATMAFGSGSAATGGQTMFLPETMVLARPAGAAAASAAMQTAQDNDDDDAAAVAESRAAMKTKKKSSKKLKSGKSATSLKSAQREPPAVASRTVAFGRADIARAAEEQTDSLPAIDL
jgi:hypothetical protein